MTLICVYNNEQQLNSMLVKSLRNSGGGKIKTLLIDNTCHKYHSCAEAYNSELQLHQAEVDDILVFLHQDIALDDDKWLQRIEQELTTNPNQLLGFAGMPTARHTVSNLRYHSTGEYITATQLTEKTEVESLDECCFAMTKKMYQQIKFDEKVCDHWHLYAVDFCYDARRRFGTKSYVLPESIYHKEDGSNGLTTDGHFLKTIWKMRQKYRNDYSMIYTPCYIMPTSPLPCIIKLGKTMVKNLLSR